MKLAKIFTREEPIAGLEISDSYLRLALLENVKEKHGKKETNRVKIATLVDQLINPDIVANGRVKNSGEFSKALKELFKKSKTKIRYLVISLPPNDVYSHIYYFPKTISPEKLKDSMKLAVDFQLPAKTQAVYFDWEQHEEHDRHVAFLASISRSVIDEYIKIFSKIDLKVVAIEFYPLSLSRVINIYNDTPTLVLSVNSDSCTISIIENRVTRFVRFLPGSFLPQVASLTGEINRAIEFYESDNNVRISQLNIIGEKSESLQKVLTNAGLNCPIVKAKIVDYFAAEPSMAENSGAWLVAMGAATRGILPRNEDELISLMPIGTEEAYEWQKAVAFIEFLSNLTIAISVFFVISFLGIWILMTSIQQSISSHLTSASSTSTSANSAELESRATNFNELVARGSKIVSKIPRWSVVIDELKNKTIAGILINRLTITNENDPIVISGVAQNRSQLNTFKKSLEDSPLFTDVKLPLTNIGQREDIVFSISLHLKNPESIYSNK